jgi:hypothetical protein
LVCHASPVLSAALNGNVIESQTLEYRLDIDGINSNVVQLLVCWIYTQHLDLSQIRIQPGLNEAEPSFTGKLDCLIKLWILGDMLLMRRLQNLIVHTIGHLCNEEGAMHMSISMLQYIYKNTAEESPLRKYIIHRCAAATLSDDFMKECKISFPDFLVDLLLLLQSKILADATATFSTYGNEYLFEVEEN